MFDRSANKRINPTSETTATLVGTVNMRFSKLRPEVDETQVEEWSTRWKSRECKRTKPQMALNLCQQVPNGAQALRLPSFLSWIQPTTSHSSVQPAPVGRHQQQHSIAQSPSLGSHVIVPSGGQREQFAKLKQQLDTESMLASPSMFEASRQAAPMSQAGPVVHQHQQQAPPVSSAARKPYQTMFMMPGKHGHLFSSLPRSLFGRLLSGGSQTGALPVNKLVGTTLQQQQHQAMTNWPGAMHDGPRLNLRPNQHSIMDEEQQNRQHFVQVNHEQQLNGAHDHRNLYRQHFKQIQTPYGSDSGSSSRFQKHALGFGESEDFLLDSSQSQVDGADSQQQPQHHYAEPQASGDQGALERSKLSTDDKQQPATTQHEAYQEMPAILITDQEAAAPAGASEQQQEQQLLAGNLSTSESSVTVDPRLETMINTTTGQTEMQASDSVLSRNASAVSDAIADLTRSMVTGNALGTSASPADSSANGLATTMPSFESNSSVSVGSTSAEHDKTSGFPEQRQVVSENNSSKPDNVLTSLINDELLKLKREPDTLNRTMASMSQPLVALFLEGPSQQTSPNKQSSNASDETGGQIIQLGMARMPEESHPIENPEAGRSESSAEAIIVAPGGDGVDGTDQISAAADGSNLASVGEEEQFESFIIGPYKGLTSDNLVMSSMNNIVTAEQDQVREADSLLANIHQQHHRQHPPQRQQPQQSHIGLGMGSMASNLIQQAKSLIHLPFVHHLASSNGGQADYPFRGLSEAMPSAAVKFREQLIEQPSSPYFFMTANQQPLLHRNRNRNRRPTMLRQEQHLLQQASANLNQYQQRPFYKQLQGNIWPSSQFGRVPAAGWNLVRNRPHNAAQSQQQQQHHPRNSNRYFLMPSSKVVKHQTGAKQPLANENNRHQQHSPRIRSNAVPYFVDSTQSGAMNHNPAQAQQQQVSHHFVPLGPPHQMRMNDNAMNLYSIQQGGQATPPTSSPLSAPILKNAAGHPLNNLAARPTQQSVGEQPIELDGSHRQQQLPSKSRKFKAGLYQIEPPKLNAEQQQQQQQQQQQVTDSEQDDEQDDSGQRQVQVADGQQQVKTEPDEQEDLDANQLAQTTDAPVVPAGDEFSRQVGATIGVAPTRRPFIKGRVFNEALPTRFPSRLLGSNDEADQGGSTNDKNLTQMRKLTFSQDVTLYDFEVPQMDTARQPASSGVIESGEQRGVSSGQQLSSAASLQHAAHQSMVASPQSTYDRPMEYLDTQVYTVPYTLSLQPNGQMSATPSFEAETKYRPSAGQQFLHNTNNQQALVSNSNLQQSQHLPPFNQVGRFPLPYLAPPNPLMTAAGIGGEQVQQFAPKFHQQAIGPQNAAGFNTVGPASAPQFPEPQNFNQVRSQSSPGDVHFEWATQHMSPVGALTMQSGGAEDRPIADVQQLDANKQRFFHYQPIGTVKPQLFPTESAAVVYPPPVATTSSFPSVSDQLDQEQNAQPQQQVIQGGSNLPASNQQQEQYVLAIRHQGDSLAPNGAALFSSNFLSSLPQPLPENTTGPIQKPAFEGNSVGNQSILEGTPSPAGNNLQADSTNEDEDNADSSGANGIGNNRQQQTDSVEPNGERDQLEQVLREQLSPAPINAAPPSTPSAFCAKREPGLYADESQSCKAYYQCAPTGHQMFRCSNKTQFNQKTQNCDWWYNVNCGGRQGSSNDYDQSPGDPASNDRNSPEEQQRQNRQRQPDRETAGSSNEERTHSSGASTSTEPELRGQQFAAEQLPNERIKTDGAQQDLPANQSGGSLRLQSQPSSMWSVTSPIKFGEGSQQDETDLQQADLFHHSESAANITVAPVGADVQRQRQHEQQVAPTSSTPTYRQVSESDIAQQQQQQASSSRQEEFAERSSTTRDPLFAQALGSGSQELSIVGGSISTESSGSLSSTESQPQVGAVLTTDTDQSLLVAPAAAQDLILGSNNRSNSDDNSSTTTTTTTSASTISADSLANNINQQVSQTETLSQPALVTSERPTPTESSQVDNQPSRVSQASDEATDSKSRRLVQSEFGVGVQQKQPHRESGAKSARSTARFEFIRNPTSSLASDPLFTGQLTAPSGSRSYSSSEQQAPNHKYSATQVNSGGNQALAAAASPQIYSTSANQGSVSYMPLDEQGAPLLPARDQQDEQTHHQPMSSQTPSRKLVRRFGTRLAVQVNNGDKLRPAAASATSGTSSTLR